MSGIGEGGSEGSESNNAENKAFGQVQTTDDINALEDHAPQGRRAKSKKNGRKKEGFLATIAKTSKVPLPKQKPQGEKDESNDPDGGQSGDDDNVGSTETRIGKKRTRNDVKPGDDSQDSLTGTIRRRARPEADSGNAKKPTTSLLENMKQPLPPPVLLSNNSGASSKPTNAEGGNTENRRDRQRQPRTDRSSNSSSNNNINNNGKQLMKVELVNLPHEVPSGGAALTPQQQQQQPPAKLPPTPTRRAAATPSFAEKRVILQLKHLCESYHSTLVPPENEFTPRDHQAVDLMGSFLRHDGTPSSSGGLLAPGIGGGIVVDDYDFFDTNEAGEIMLQGRKPMFPEDFKPGMEEHSLSWWGVVDPELGKGRFSAAAPSPPEHHRSSPMNKQGGPAQYPNNAYNRQMNPPSGGFAGGGGGPGRPYHRQHSSNSFGPGISPRGGGGGGFGNGGSTLPPNQNQRPPPQQQQFNNRRGGHFTLQDRR